MLSYIRFFGIAIELQKRQVCAVWSLAALNELRTSKWRWRYVIHTKCAHL